MTVIAALLTPGAIIIGSDTRSSRGDEIVSNDARKVWPLDSDGRIVVAHWGAATHNGIPWTVVLDEFRAPGQPKSIIEAVRPFVDHYWTHFRAGLGDVTAERDRLISEGADGITADEHEWLIAAGCASACSMIVGGFDPDSTPFALEIEINIVRPAPKVARIPIGRIVQHGHCSQSNPDDEETDFSAVPLRQATEAIHRRVSDMIRQCARTGSVACGGDVEIGVIEVDRPFILNRYQP